MSCSDITVQIIGDTADIQVYVTQAQQSATQAASSATDAQQSAVQAASSATDAQQAAQQSATSASQAAATVVTVGRMQEHVDQVDARITGFVTSAGQARDEAVTSAAQSSSSASQAASSATAASQAADRAERAPVSLKVSKDGNLLNETSSEFDFTGNGVTVKQKQSDTSIFIIDIPGQIPVSVADITGLQAALDAKESHLGAPISDYQVLASKKDGTRYWVSQNGAGGSPLSIEKVGSVQHLVDVLQIGEGLAIAVSGRVVTLSADVTQSEIDTLTTRINNLYVKTKGEFDQSCAAAIAPYATRITALENGASITSQDIVNIKSQIAAILQSVQSLQAAKIDKVESKVNPASKTITLTFKSGNTVIGTDLIDISSMFAVNPPADQHAIWFGFTTVKPPDESQIKKGDTEQDHVIIGHDITLTRPDVTPAYMYVWIPDIMGAITGFSFAHSFVDVWQSWPVTVDGEVGKVYVSDNQTATKSVSFEVQ